MICSTMMRSSSVWLEAWLAFPPPNFSGDHQAFYGDIMISLREFPLWTQSSFGLSIHVRLIWKVDSPMILERAKEVSRAFLLLQQTFLTFSSTQLLWLSHFLNDCQILQLYICIRLIFYTWLSKLEWRMYFNSIYSKLLPKLKCCYFAARWRSFLDCLLTKGASWKRHLGSIYKSISKIQVSKNEKKYFKVFRIVCF